jgi:hypothetical protein
MPVNTFIGTFPFGGMTFGAWITGRQGLLLLPWTNPPTTSSPSNHPSAAPTPQQARRILKENGIKWIDKPKARQDKDGKGLPTASSIASQNS